jgi:hypothetical protein
VVLIMIISTAPSSLSSGKLDCEKEVHITSVSVQHKQVKHTHKVRTHVQRQPAVPPPSAVCCRGLTLSRSRVMYAWASARGEPRVPIFTTLVAVAEANTWQDWRLLETTSLHCLGAVPLRRRGMQNGYLGVVHSAISNQDSSSPQEQLT